MLLMMMIIIITYDHHDRGWKYFGNKFPTKSLPAALLVLHIIVIIITILTLLHKLEPHFLLKKVDSLLQKIRLILQSVDYYYYYYYSFL